MHEEDTVTYVEMLGGCPQLEARGRMKVIERNNYGSDRWKENENSVI